MTVALADTPVLTTSRLTLRAPQASDWPVWRDFAMSDRARYIGGPFTLGLAWRALGHAVGMWVLRGFGSFIFAIKGSNAPIGLAGPWHPADWAEPEIGWTIWNPAHEGNGYAFEAAHAARAYAYTSLGWTTAVSYIDPDNARSIALAERLGATLDRDAPRHDPPDLVYRHPAPEALQ